MTAFPGFADPGSFKLKMDEFIAGLGAQIGAQMPDADLFGDVLTGEIGLAVTNLESVMMGSAEAPVIIGLAVANEELAAPVFEQLTGSMSSSEVTEQTYGGAVIYSDGSTAASMYDGWVLLSPSVDAVMASIDVLDGNAESLAGDPAFEAAWADVPAGHIAAGYVNVQAFGSLIELGSMMAEGQAGMSLPTADILALLPVDMVVYLVAEADRMTLDLTMTPGEGTPTLPSGESDLASLYPADTQLYVETRELGATVHSALTGLADVLAAQEQISADGGTDGMAGLSQIEMLFGDESPITAMLGVPLPEFLDFVGDASVGAGINSDGLSLGIAAEINDDALAQERLTSLMTVLRLLTMESAEGQPSVTMETETIEGVEVTNITVPLEDMVAGSGLPITLDDTISLAIADGALLIGLGDFVPNAILGDAADSLATSPGFVDALGADTVNTGLMYANISSLVGALDPMLATLVPQWPDIAPYVEGLDSMIVVGTADDESMGARMTLIVGQ
jgi:hypothetical protein